MKIPATNGQTVQDGRNRLVAGRGLKLLKLFGAGDGIRTHGLDLGKVAKALIPPKNYG
jgi:hypothetical protein